MSDNTPVFKKCGTCQQVKPVTEFCKDKSRKDGYNHRCKQCAKIRQQSPNAKAYHADYYQSHKEEHDEASKRWHENNRDLLNLRFRTIYRKPQTNYMVNRRHNDPLFRLSTAFSANLRMSLKSAENRLSKNGKHWEDIVGYTVQDLVAHLESKFQNGMTWDNYGQWHIDHIKPIASFNILEVGDDEFKMCWSLDNLQPLWASDNIRKSDNVGPEWSNE